MTELSDLRLVRILPTYPAYSMPGSGHSFFGDGGPIDAPADSDARVFWAYDDNPYVRIVTPTSGDPRGYGFYRQSADPEGHKGWNVELEHVEDVSSPDAERVVTDASQLRKGDAFKAGSDRSTQYVATGDVVEGDNGKRVALAWDGNSLDAWAGPRMPVAVTLIPVEEQSAWTRAKVAEVTGQAVESAPEESGDQSAAVAAAVAAERARLTREFEEWKRRATETAHEYADNNSLCSEFDRCMEEIGLEPRNREEEYEVHICGTITVTASSEDEARDLAVSEFNPTYHVEDVSVA